MTTKENVRHVRNIISSVDAIVLTHSHRQFYGMSGNGSVKVHKTRPQSKIFQPKHEHSNLIIYNMSSNCFMCPCACTIVYVLHCYDGVLNI